MRRRQRVALPAMCRQRVVSRSLRRLRARSRASHRMLHTLLAEAPRAQQRLPPTPVNPRAFGSAEDSACKACLYGGLSSETVEKPGWRGQCLHLLLGKPACDRLWPRQCRRVSESNRHGFPYENWPCDHNRKRSESHRGSSALTDGSICIARRPDRAGG